MPNPFDTWVYSNISSFFGSFWQDTTGKIFILTFIAYSASYMLYSGYISGFAGGFGGLLLSHAGFTALDFLTLIPTASVLLLRSIDSFIRFTVKHIILFLVLPFTILILVALLLTNFDVQIIPEETTLAPLGFLLWILVFALPILEPEIVKNRLLRLTFIGLSVFSAIIIAISLPFYLTSPGPTPTTPNATSGANILNEIIAACFVIIITLLPNTIGANLAETAVQKALLSKVIRITLRQPLEFPDSIRTVIDSRSLQEISPHKHWLMNKVIPIQIPSEAFSYTWDSEKQPFLITSFSHTTAFYFCSDNQNHRGKMILVSNDLIYSLELQSKSILQDIRSN